MTPDDTQQLLYRILNTEQQKRLEIDRQIDLSYAISGVARFRVNVFFQRSAVAAVFRLIPYKILTLEELGLPGGLHELADKPRGLVLVTGPTGSGKSTTLAALIDEINRNRAGHILTIEDPIEFLHSHQPLPRQPARGRRRHARLRRGAARRPPPGPRRDPRRRDARPRDDLDRADRRRDRPPRLRHAAHDGARPGRSTASSTSSPPSSRTRSARSSRPALEGVVTQTLLPTADGQGRVAALEILLPDDAVRNLIRQRKLEQIYSVMQTGTTRGMQTMEQSLCDLVLRGTVSTRGRTRQLELPGPAGRPARALRRRSRRTERRSHPPPTPPDSGWRGADMGKHDETSVWKKEISFRKKPKRREGGARLAAGGRACCVGRAGREVLGLEEGDRLRPQGQAEAAEPVSAAARRGAASAAGRCDRAGRRRARSWRKEISFGRKAKPEASAAEARPQPVEEAKKSVWKKEIGSGRKPKTEVEATPAPVEAAVAALEPAHAVPAVSPPVEQIVPEPAPPSRSSPPCRPSSRRLADFEPSPSPRPGRSSRP